ncbi:MAG: choloylglycine hydrolase [Clostridia bacterium]|nr:choloylglycine hydrolase [Clostridia bacterium]
MCTAISYKVRNHYFGRNLDMECSFNESVIVMPRKFPFTFRYAQSEKENFAIIGAGIVRDDVPLFYDGTNEKGLSMAGLSFVGNARYGEIKEGSVNIAPFELIPWVLMQCESVKQAKALLEKTNVAHIDFSSALPCAELHWLISDDRENLVLECTEEGMMLYDNPLGVLTNNPPFPLQMFSLNNYMRLTNQPPVNTFCKSLSLQEYSRGMGAIGLPGDLSSTSRFVRVAFNKLNSVCPNSESKRVSQFFHLLYSVYQTRGAVQVKGGKYEYTVYSACCNTKKGIYYYTAYDNYTITAIDMKKENMDGEKLAVYPMKREGEFFYGNKAADGEAL